LNTTVNSFGHCITHPYYFIANKAIHIYLYKSVFFLQYEIKKNIFLYVEKIKVYYKFLYMLYKFPDDSTSNLNPHANLLVGIQNKKLNPKKQAISFKRLKEN